MKNIDNSRTFYCEKCGENVAVKEKPGNADTVQLRHVLVGECRHIVAERSVSGETWKTAT